MFYDVENQNSGYIWGAGRTIVIKWAYKGIT